MTGDDSVLAGGIGDAHRRGVSGTWVASAIQEKLGDNYGCCKLPTFTCDGQAGSDGLLPWLQDLRRQLPDRLSRGLHGAGGVSDQQQKAQIERYNVLNYGPSNVQALADDTIASNLALRL